MGSALPLPGGRRQHGDGIGYTQGLAAATGATGSYSTNTHPGVQLHCRHQISVNGVGHQTDIKQVASLQMNCDIAAVIDIGFRQAPAFQHRGQNFVGNGPGYRSHGGDK